MSDDFADDLLTGDAKWWEFLDPQTYEVRDDLPRPTHSSSEQLDWSRKKTRRGPVGFAYFNHCNSCGQGVPPDFTFCVHCGGLARSTSRAQTFTIVIARLEGERAQETAEELFTTAGHDLSVEEVSALFAELPAVFNVTARRDQVAALTAKLSETGIAARAFSVDDVSVPWFRETCESLIRKTGMLFLALGVFAAGIILSWFWSPVALLLAIGALVGIFVRELRWYRERYHVDHEVLLQLLTGFDPMTAKVARETLQLMSDREARQSVTVCLMEYYTLTHQIRSHRDVYGAVLDRTGEALEELMADVLVLAHRYAKMDDFLRSHRPAALQQRLDELREQAFTDPATAKMVAAEVAALEEQLATMRQMEDARQTFRERLSTLARSMESMRSRFAAVRAQPSTEAFERLEFEEALQELDEEFEVFEETFAVVGQ